MKLMIKNFESLEKKQWDDNNFIEDVIDRGDQYIFSIWRQPLRKIVVLEKTPETNGYYKIGIYDTTTGVSSVTHPYWIKVEDIKNPYTFMNKLKLITDYWEIKLI